MTDGTLLYRRAKIRVVMSQAEFVTKMFNDGVKSVHTQISFFLYAEGDTLHQHLKNTGYDTLQTILW